MKLISLKNVSLNYPLYGFESFSIRKRFLSLFKKNINRYKTFQSINAINNVSFDVKQGDRIALVGHNGAGKTSLLKLISQIYLPTTGDFFINGNINPMIDINFGIDPDATGRQNIFFRGLLMGFDRKKINDKIDEIIEFSGLGDYIDAPVMAYSSGMNIRLAFSISSHFESDIILMDEWLSVGDLEFRKKAEKKLNSMIEKSQALVLASHDFDTVKRICNRLIILKKGEIVVNTSEVNNIDTLAQIYM